MSNYDTLIVGGGTAGARLASRLALAGRTNIGLIEAGGLSQPIRSRVPAWYPWCFGSSIDWAWETSPQPELYHRRLRWPRGKLLGGSGAINALIDIQSSTADWDRWGWNWASHICTTDIAPFPESQKSLHLWSSDFLAACQQLGLESIDRLEQSNNNVCGALMLARRNGVRVHTGQDLEKLPSVHLVPNATATEILFEESKAIGVRVATGSSNDSVRWETIRANRIVLCAGALGTPDLLFRSGIGPLEELQQLNIACRLDLPGVGKNLQDHLVMPIVYRARQPQGLPRLHGRLAREQFRQSGSGSLASNIAEATALIGQPGCDTAQFQVHFTPSHYWKYPIGDDGQKFLSLNFTDLHPRSRGQLRWCTDLDSGSIEMRIDPGYLGNEADATRLGIAFELTATIAKQSKLAQHILEPLTLEPTELDETIHLVRKFAQSIYHPVGSCAMSSPIEGYDPVVNSDFRLFHVENLWVADASVLPDLPSCNPNRTVILIADRLAQLLT